MLAKDACKEEWQYLDKFIVSIRWHLILNKEHKREFYWPLNASCVKINIEDTIVTNPLVPLTSRKEFEYNHLKHKNLSYYTINTTSNFKYKSLGNIFYNLTKWISSHCQTNKHKQETLKLQFCVNITYASQNKI